MIKNIRHRDTETQRKTIQDWYFSVSLCLCGKEVFQYET